MYSILYRRLCSSMYAAKLRSPALRHGHGDWWHWKKPGCSPAVAGWVEHKFCVVWNIRGSRQGLAGTLTGKVSCNFNDFQFSPWVCFRKPSLRLQCPSGTGFVFLDKIGSAIILIRLAGLISGYYCYCWVAPYQPTSSKWYIADFVGILGHLRAIPRPFCVCFGFLRHGEQWNIFSLTWHLSKCWRGSCCETFQIHSENCILRGPLWVHERVCGMFIAYLSQPVRPLWSSSLRKTWLSPWFERAANNLCKRPCTCVSPQLLVSTAPRRCHSFLRSFQSRHLSLKLPWIHRLLNLP